MHLSAMAAMDECLSTYLSRDEDYRILDFGSFINHGQSLNHRMLLEGYRCTVTGVDVQAGRNVDRQMTRPYRIPVRSGSQDVVISGQVFEHVPYPFASMLEIARVLRPGGYVFLTMPSRGHRHSTYDLWRYYPDSLRAFARYAELELIEAHTDLPPRIPGRKRHHYAGIGMTHHYWGDTVGVLRKPPWRPSLRRAVHRWVELQHANARGDLDGVPIPGTRKPTGAQRRRQQAALADRLGLPRPGSATGTEQQAAQR